MINYFRNIMLQGPIKSLWDILSNKYPLIKNKDNSIEVLFYIYVNTKYNFLNQQYMICTMDHILLIFKKNFDLLILIKNFLL
jgi:hypothetical protein